MRRDSLKPRLEDVERCHWITPLSVHSSNARKRGGTQNALSKEVAIAPVIAAIAFAPNIPAFDESVCVSPSASRPSSPSSRCLPSACPFPCLSRIPPLPSPVILLRGCPRWVYAYSASTFPRNPALEEVARGLLGPASGHV